MILAESPRMYPVFTHHTAELQAAARYLVGRMEKYKGGSAADKVFNALLDRYMLVIRTLTAMEKAKDPYVYLDQDEKELVVRINTWLKKNPEHRQ